MYYVTYSEDNNKTRKLDKETFLHMPDADAFACRFPKWKMAYARSFDHPEVLTLQLNNAHALLREIVNKSTRPNHVDGCDMPMVGLRAAMLDKVREYLEGVK